MKNGVNVIKMVLGKQEVPENMIEIVEYERSRLDHVVPYDFLEEVTIDTMREELRYSIFSTVEKSIIAKAGIIVYRKMLEIAKGRSLTYRDFYQEFEKDRRFSEFFTSATERTRNLATKAVSRYRGTTA